MSGIVRESCCSGTSRGEKTGILEVGGVVINIVSDDFLP